MKRVFFWAILAMPFLFACQTSWDVESVSTLNDAPKVFYATLEQTAPDTKVYADENLRVLWNANDSINLFDHYSYGKKYRFDGPDGANAGTFTDIEPSTSFIVGNELSHVYAIYPYSPYNGINNAGTVLQLTLPEEQTYKENSFGIGANTMIATGDDNNLRFKNLCGYLCLKLYGNGVNVSRVMLKVNEGQERISGDADVTVGHVVKQGKDDITVLDDEPVVNLVEPYDSHMLILNCPTPVPLGATVNDYKVFWLVVPPVTFSDGFTVYVEDNHGKQFSKSTHNAITIKRSTMTKMAPIEVVVPE